VELKALVDVIFTVDTVPAIGTFIQQGVAECMVSFGCDDAAMAALMAFSSFNSGRVHGQFRMR